MNLFRLLRTYLKRIKQRKKSRREASSADMEFASLVPRESLDDLPTEMIEQICEYACQDQYFGYSVAHIRGLRLACRFLQQASRRTSFRHGYSARELWPAPADVQFLHAMAQKGDIADSLTKLVICCPDDVDPSICEHPDDIAGRVPYTLRLKSLQDNAFDAAIARSGNLDHVFMTDSMVGFDNMHHRRMPQQGYQIDFISDITTTFGVVIAALSAAGRAPKSITARGVHHGMMHAGISDCSALINHPTVLNNLRLLDLTFPAGNGRHASPEARGTHTGQHLTQAARHMPLLDSLSFNFQRSQAASVAAMQQLTQAPAIPRLRRLHIRETNARYSDAVTFIVKHKETLESFELEQLILEADSFVDIRDGFSQLLECTKVAHVQFFEARVVSWAERVIKGLHLPQCRGFYGGRQELWYGYGLYEDEAEGEQLEGWMAVDNGPDIFTIGGKQYVKEVLLELMECFGGLPWAD